MFQPDLMIESVGQDFKLVGFLDMGGYANDLYYLKNGKHSIFVCMGGVMKTKQTKLHSVLYFFLL